MSAKADVGVRVFWLNWAFAEKGAFGELVCLSLPVSFALSCSLPPRYAFTRIA